MEYCDFDGMKVAYPAENETTFTSGHTGDTLKRTRLHVAAPDLKTHEQLTSAIRKGIVNSVDEQGNVLRKWKIGNNSHSYTATEANPVYYHKIELEELEALNIEALILDELTLTPYYYEEIISDGLEIKAKVLISEEQYAELKKLMLRQGYFPVIRKGISEQSKEMRFGLTHWSKHDNGIKHEIRLVERTYDEANKGARTLFDDVFVMEEIVAEHMEYFKNLLDILVTKGVLSSEEVDHITKPSADKLFDNRRAYFRDADIDDYKVY